MPRTLLNPLPEIRRRLAGRFEYIDLAAAERLLLIPFGFYGWVCVIGHPDHGSYEWVARCDGGFDHESDPPSYEHSNCGYGCTAAAMRDGLVRMVE